MSVVWSGPCQTGEVIAGPLTACGPGWALSTLDKCAQSMIAYLLHARCSRTSIAIDSTQEYLVYQTQWSAPVP